MGPSVRQTNSPGNFGITNGKPDLFTGRKEELEGIGARQVQITKEADDYCREKGIACSEDEKWLGL